MMKVSLFLALLCLSTSNAWMTTTTSFSTRATVPSTTTTALHLRLPSFGRKKTEEVVTVQDEVTTPPTAVNEEQAAEPTFMKEVTLEDNKEDNTASGLDPKAKMAAMMAPIKEAGVAGALSLFLWEAAFWIISIPVCSIAYYQATGSWPDWQNAEDVAKVGAEAFAFANIARFALPLRVGLAVATTPWVQANLVDRFMNKDGEDDNKEE